MRCAMDDTNDPVDEGAEHEIRFLGDMKKVTWGPNDIGVITYPGKLSPQGMERIQLMWKRLMGENPKHKLMVLSEGMQFGVISDG
jgi:hypothetical protein